MAAHQAPPSLGFSRQEHWSGLPFPSPMHESEKWKWSAQSCPTLSDPMDCSLLGSSIHGIFQARVLECGAIAFSKYKGIHLDSTLVSKDRMVSICLSLFIFQCVALISAHLRIPRIVWLLSQFNFALIPLSLCQDLYLCEQSHHLWLCRATPWHCGRKWVIRHPWSPRWFWDNAGNISYTTPFPSFCVQFWLFTPSWQNVPVTILILNCILRGECLDTHLPLIKILTLIWSAWVILFISWVLFGKMLILENREVSFPLPPSFSTMHYSL